MTITSASQTEPKRFSTAIYLNNRMISTTDCVLHEFAVYRATKTEGHRRAVSHQPADESDLCR
jgi:hypothetical protein